MNWIIKNTGIFDTKCHTMAHRNGLGDDMGGRGDGNQDWGWNSAILSVWSEYGTCCLEIL